MSSNLDRQFRAELRLDALSGSAVPKAEEGGGVMCGQPTVVIKIACHFPTQNLRSNSQHQFPEHGYEGQLLFKDDSEHLLYITSLASASDAY